MNTIIVLSFIIGFPLGVSILISWEIVDLFYKN